MAIPHGDHLDGPTRVTLEPAAACEGGGLGGTGGRLGSGGATIGEPPVCVSALGRVLAFDHPMHGPNTYTEFGCDCPHRQAVGSGLLNIS